MKKIGIIALCFVLLGTGIFLYKHSSNEEPVISIEGNNLQESGEGDNLAELEPKGDLPDAEGDLSDEEEGLSGTNENDENKEDKNVVVTGSSEIAKVKAQLAQAKDIEEITVSPDNNYVAYFKGERESLTQQLFLWEVEDKSPQPIEGVKDQAFGYIFWSPNSEYLFIDDGTWVLRGGTIVSAKEKKQLDSFLYEDFVWSPDSKYLALSVPGDIEPIIDIDPNASDLVLYDVRTQEKKIIVPATSEYRFFPTKWDEDGTLHYVKHYYTEEPDEELTIKLEKELSKYRVIDLNNIPDLSDKKANDKEVIDLIATLYNDIYGRELISEIDVITFEPICISSERKEYKDYLVVARVGSNASWYTSRNIIAVLKDKNINPKDRSYEVCFMEHTIADLIDEYGFYELIDLDSDGGQEIVFKTFEATQGGGRHVHMYIFKYKEGKYEVIFDEGIHERDAIYPHRYDNSYEFVQNKNNPQLYDLVFKIKRLNEEEYYKGFKPPMDYSKDYDELPIIEDEVVFSFDGEKYIANKSYNY